MQPIQKYNGSIDSEKNTIFSNFLIFYSKSAMITYGKPHIRSHRESNIIENWFFYSVAVKKYIVNIAFKNIPFGCFCYVLLPKCTQRFIFVINDK